MSRLQLLLVLFASSVLWPRAHSQDPGPGDCISNATLTTATQVVFAPPGTVCFQCEFDGVVATDSTFQINNGDVGDEGTIVMGVLVIFDSERVFETTTPRTVRCVSGGSSISVLTFLEILRPPVITGDTTVNEGGNLTLDCDVSNSQPPPSVAWFSPEGEMLVGQRRLLVPAIVRSQAGEYRCVATQTESGDSSNSTVDVTVQYPPDVFANLPGTIDFPLGGTLQLGCTYQGIPPPNMVSWRNNATDLLESNPDVTIAFDDTSTTLTRTNLPADGGGTYTCTATNVVGSGEATTSVRVQLPPDPPTGLVVMEETTTSLFVRWENPDFDGFSPIAGFRVNIMNERTSVSDNKTFSGSVSTTEYNITDLSPFTNYTIDLYVRNEVNLEGEPGTVREATVSLRFPPVTLATITSVSSTEIRVQWMDPTFDPTTTDAVDRYELTYREEDGGQNMTRDVLPAASYNETITGLEKGTRYVLTITPFNSVGAGPTYTLAFETAVDPPTPPQNFTVTAVDPFTLDLSWSAPADSGGRPIDRYLIEYHQAGDGASGMATAVGADVQSYRIEGLMENTTYEVTITVNNTDGLDSSNVTMEQATPPVPPPLPPTPVYSDVTNMSTLISWTATDEYPDFYLLQYKRRIHDWSNENTTNTLNLSSSVLSQPLTDLEPLTSYDVRMQSQNIRGLSAFSNEVEFVTFGDIMIDGPAQNETQPSGATITLTCSLGGAEQGVDYMWTRDDGEDLPPNSETSGGSLVLLNAQEGYSGVYICTAQGVSGRFNVMVAAPTSEPTESDGGVSTTVIAIAASVGGVALIIFLVVVTVAVLCLCCFKRDGSKLRNRTYSFRPRHWADASGSHTGSRSKDKREELAQSFHLPNDYQTHTSFNTADTVRHSPPSSHSYNGIDDNTVL